MKYDYLIVGAGLYGSVMAERVKSIGKSVLVIDQRDHIGGNCFSEKIFNIDVHKYGPHIFHTDNDRVIKYINQFAVFDIFTHSVRSFYNGQYYSFPINLKTINQFYGLNLKEFDACGYLNNIRDDSADKSNLEGYALSVMGKDLYAAFIKGYTIKQWGIDPKNIPADTLMRLPFRLNDNDLYFNDKYQGVPVDGYAQMFQKMLEGIPVYLGFDYILYRDYFNDCADTIIYTGPIDRYFNYCCGALSWRSINFAREIIPIERPDKKIDIIQYPEMKYHYTRVSSYDGNYGTVRVSEYPGSDKDNPYYPVNSDNDKVILSKYKELAENEKRVIFGGRLAEYKYYDMDDIIDKALVDFDEKIYNKQ
jgi:UDP-galactopyranose mutase